MKIEILETKQELGKTATRKIAGILIGTIGAKVKRSLWQLLEHLNLVFWIALSKHFPRISDYLSSCLRINVDQIAFTEEVRL